MRTETLSFLIYLLSVGVLGLLGYELYQKHDMRWVGVPGVGESSGTAAVASVAKWRKAAVQKGTRSAISERRWSYAPRMMPWWDVITKANLTGKLPPPPKEVVNEAEAEAQAAAETPQTPLSEILTIVTTFGSDTGTIKVQYKPESGVTPPKRQDIGIGDAVPGMSPGMAPGQTQPGLGPLYQDLTMGESLYEPFQAIKAVRVVSQGSEIGVVFSRPAAKPEDAKAGKRTEETVWINQLDIQGNHFGGLATVGAGSPSGPGKAGGAKTERKGVWQDPGPKTKKIADAWQISIQDQKYLANPAELFEDVAVEDFREEWDDPITPGKKVRVRGVAISKVSPKLKRFGVQEGEILIKVNGNAVTGRANAMKVGKDAYNRGVRTFDLTFLNNYGREIVRTYQAK